MGEISPEAPAVWEERASDADVARLPATMAFDVFYQREFAGLVALARALTRAPTTAEDIAQEAMIVAYRRWDEVSALDIPAAWVRRVCANMATSTIRRRAAEARALVRLGARRPEITELSAPEEAFWSEVRRLPRRQAQVVALHYVYDLPVVEIANTLGCSASTVKAHLVRARGTLAARLAVEEDS